jgi:ribosomal protein L6P/L9E
MSRIGKLPVKLPAGVSVDVKAGTIQVKGRKARSSVNFPRPFASASKPVAS